MMTRWMLLLCLAACGSSSGTPTTPSTPTTTPTPTESDSVLSADGTRVSTERVYEGDCMPAGSRGGCHTITLRPDGTYRNFLFDAAMSVKMTASDPGMVEELPLSADGSKLGTLSLKTSPAE
jgi:hypothetical protein